MTSQKHKKKALLEDDISLPTQPILDLAWPSSAPACSYSFPNRHTKYTGVKIASLLHNQSLTLVQGYRVSGSFSLISLSLMSSSSSNHVDNTFCFVESLPNISLYRIFLSRIFVVSNFSVIWHIQVYVLANLFRSLLLPRILEDTLYFQHINY